MKKKILAAILAATLSVAMLAGCSSLPKAGKNFNAVDYTIPTDALVYQGVRSGFISSKLYTAATRFDNENRIVEGTVKGSPLLQYADADGKHYGYDIFTGDILFGGKGYVSIEPASDTYKCTDESGKDTYYSSNGRFCFLPAGEYSEVVVETEFEKYYVDGSIFPSVVAKLSYKTGTDGSGSPAVKYYVSDDGIKATSYTEISKDRISETSPYLAPGNVIGETPQPLYPTYEGMIEKTEYSDYAVSVVTTNETSIASGLSIGDMTVSVYKNADKTASIDIHNGFTAGYTGKYIYYAELEPRAYDAKKGYNLLVQPGNTAESARKFNVTYYRYDITKNSAKKYDPKYAPVEIQPLYNYADKTFDAAIVMALTKTDGIYLYTGVNDLHLFATDVDLKVGKDLTATPLQNIQGYRLKANRTLIENTIVDDELEVVATADNIDPTKSTDKYLVYKTSSSEKYGVLDFDGRVLVRAEYDEVTVTGDYAVLESNDEYFVADLNTTAEPRSINQVAGVQEDTDTTTTTCTARLGLIIKIVTDTAGGTKVATVYNAAGTQLCAFENVVNDYSNDVMVLNAGVLGSDHAAVMTRTDQGVVCYIVE